MFPLESKILLVDDMPVMREMIRKALNVIGFRSIVEHEGVDPAWKSLQSHHHMGQPFDLIISDWNMPNKSGYDFLLMVKADKLFKNLPFILLTSETEKEKIIDAIQAGVTQYIIKPSPMSEISTKLAQAWSNHNKRKVIT
jgi:two-component system chemotaxis response regulator CheY